MKINILLCLTLFSVIANGQVRQPHSLYFMETIPQISQMNPAFQPRANGYVMLPGVNVDLISELAVKEILQQQKNNWYLPVQSDYDFKKLWYSIGEKETVSFNSGTDVDIFGYGIRVGAGYFSFGLSEHFIANTTLPSDLFRIAEQRDVPNKKTYDFSPLHAQAMAFMQIRLGYSRKLNDRLTLGVNVKPLFGHAAFVSEVEKFKVVRENSILTSDVRGSVYTSKIIDKIEKDNAEDYYNVIFKNFEDNKSMDWINYGADFTNPGVAFDIGAAYQITKRFTVSAALNNLGFVSWKEDVKWLSSNISVSYDEESDVELDEWLAYLKDELNNSFKFREQQDKFTTTLSPVLHAGASYQLFESLSVGLLSRTVFWKNHARQSFNLSGYFQPYSFFALNAGATLQVKGNFYMGGGLTFLLGPLQIYVLADYIPIKYYSLITDDGDKIPYIPEHPKTFTVRTGLNLIFGRHGFANKPMLDRRKNSWN